MALEQDGAGVVMVLEAGVAEAVEVVEQEEVVEVGEGLERWTM